MHVFNFCAFSILLHKTREGQIEKDGLCWKDKKPSCCWDSRSYCVGIFVVGSLRAGSWSV